MLSDSCGWPGFKSRPGRNLKTCNFKALEVTAMYFTFLETSNLFLFGQERSRAYGKKLQLQPGSCIHPPHFPYNVFNRKFVKKGTLEKDFPHFLVLISKGYLKLRKDLRANSHQCDMHLYKQKKSVSRNDAHI